MNKVLLAISIFSLTFTSALANAGWSYEEVMNYARESNALKIRDLSEPIKNLEECQRGGDYASAGPVRDLSPSREVIVACEQHFGSKGETKALIFASRNRAVADYDSKGDEAAYALAQQIANNEAMVVCQQYAKEHRLKGNCRLLAAFTQYNTGKSRIIGALGTATEVKNDPSYFARTLVIFEPQ